VIAIRRTEVRPFSDRQIALLATFADQAVIAIENTRLFEEVQARSFSAIANYQMRGGLRTVLAVPLLREGQPMGAISLARTVVAPFGDKQIALVETFADQAVIAIENTRLFEAEQASKRELQESLEYQTATSDVLNVISRSKFDLQPVLDSIVGAATRLCACDMATIRRREGDVYVQLAGYGLPDDYAEYSRNANCHHAGRGSLVGRVLQEGKAVQIPDVLADPDYTRRVPQHAWRSVAPWCRPDRHYRAHASSGTAV
jgi:K+-sensing histidine kinase KdpD